jgi:NAD(P)H-dependent flavin oxidoreductase YrpB (nitropropane dioxygenase family)
MRTPICDLLGIEYPIFGFTPSPQVAAAISRAGGMGVLGCIRYTDLDEMKRDLAWLDAAVEGKPYGLDIVMPRKIAVDASPDVLKQHIDERYWTFVRKLLAHHEVPPLPDDIEAPGGITGWMHSFAYEQLEVIFEYPIGLLANALGPPPKDVIDRAREHGVKVAALAGTAKHARRHVEAGVDIIVAQGHEAGGHCGDVTSMVLVPEVVAAAGDTPVLAAGGIGTGQQIAAALALGAEGAWLGSRWLTTTECVEPGPVITKKLLEATSSDTLRSRVVSGKPARMLKTAWTEAWSAEDSPGTLPMPLQGALVADAEARIRYHQHPELLGMPVGQIVGQMNDVRPVAEIMAELVTGFQAAQERLASF